MKLVEDSLSRVYELTYLVPATLTADELEKVTQLVQKLVKKYGGRILETEDWGKRELSYVIKHKGEQYSEAFYRHLKIKLNTNKIQNFEKDIYLLPELMRHLLVIADEAPQTESTAKEAGGEDEAQNKEVEKEKKIDKKDKK